MNVSGSSEYGGQYEFNEGERTTHTCALESLMTSAQDDCTDPVYPPGAHFSEGTSTF